MKQCEEGGSLTQSHLSCLPLSRMSIWCKRRVKEGPWSSTSESNVTWEKKWGRRSEKKERGERNREGEENRFAKGEGLLITLDFLAGFRNSMTLTYREIECFSFLPSLIELEKWTENP